MIYRKMPMVKIQLHNPAIATGLLRKGEAARLTRRSPDTRGHALANSTNGGA